MATKKDKTKKDDLFSEFEDFFSQPDADPFWADEVEEAPVVIEVARPAATPPPAPPPRVNPPVVVAPPPVVVAPPPVAAPRVSPPPVVAAPPPAPPAPIRPNASLFAAQTVILPPSAAPVEEVEEEVSAETPVVTFTSAAAAARRPAPAFLEESLFDSEAFFAEPTREVPISEVPGLAPDAATEELSPHTEDGELMEMDAAEDHPVAESPMFSESVSAGAAASRGTPPVAALDAGVMDESYDEEATADDFLEALGDASLVMRRPTRPGDDDTGETAEGGPRNLRSVPPSAAELLEYDSEEIRLAQAERATRFGLREADEPSAELSLETDSAPAPPAPPAPTPPTVVAPTPPPAPVEAPIDTPMGVRESFALSDDDADGWLRAAVALEQEGEDADEAEPRSALFAAAGRIHYQRLNNWEEAARLFRAAMENGLEEPEVLGEFSRVAGTLGDFWRLRDALTRRAAVLEGAAAAEALHDAALVERNNLRRVDVAIGLAESALVANPSDWFALRLLRDVFTRSRNWVALTGILDRMARVASGHRAARLQAERGRILEVEMGQVPAALEAYRAARAAEPAYTPAFLALDRLLRQVGDGAALVDLLVEEGDRLGGPDATFLRVRAARVGGSMGLDTDAVALLWQAALAAGGAESLEIRREHQSWLASVGRFAELADSFADEAASRTGTEAAWCWYRRGGVLEHQLHDVEGALQAYRQVLAHDPAAGVALRSASRLLERGGRFQEVVDLLWGLVDSMEDPNLTVTTLYRIGELCEGRLNDQVGARLALERILDTAPGYLPALEGLERVYTRLEAWQPLAAIYEQRAILCEDPAGMALQLHRAASVHDLRLKDDARSSELYGRALDCVADFPPSLDALARILERRGDWASLAAMLRRAADVCKESNEVVSFTYRAARILADRVGDPVQAAALLRRCLELSPGFLPAIHLLRDLAVSTGSAQEVCDLERLEADSVEDAGRRHWGLLAAAEAAERLSDRTMDRIIDELLTEDQQSYAGIALLEERALLSADRARVAEVFRQVASNAPTDAARASLAARVADHAAEANDPSGVAQALAEVLHTETAAAPLRSLARLAEGMMYWEDAQRALAASGDASANIEIARIIEAFVEDPNASAGAWRMVLAQSPDDIVALSGLERALSRTSHKEGLADVHARLATRILDRAIQRVHALLAGHLYEAQDRRDEATAMYRIAFLAQPGPGKALEGLRPLLAQAGDLSGLEELFALVPELDAVTVASTWEDAGSPERAIAVYEGALAATPAGLRNPLLARLELNQMAVGDWSGVFRTLTARLDETHTHQGRAAIEAKRRWVLAEKLSHTDEAWGYYQELHRSTPQDAEVLESLARIAGARGETSLAIRYLTALSTVSSRPDDRARYQRRIAEALLVTGDADGARSAYMLALDHAPDDAEALSGLRRIAEAAGDWRTSVGVMEREAAMSTGDRRLELQRRAALAWQTQVGDLAAADDAWRKVLAAAPGDREATTALLAITRGLGDWAAWVELGKAQLPSLAEGERTALLAELGSVCLRQLFREDDALRFLDLATRGAAPHLESAVLMEQIFVGRGAWDQAVDAIRRQAVVLPPAAAAVALARAAGLCLEHTGDSSGASALYQEVLDRDPQHPDALRYQAEYLYSVRDLAGAVKVFERMEEGERARDLDDFDVRIDVGLYYYRFAAALVELGRAPEAISRFEKGLELSPNHLPSLEAVGPLYMAARMWDRAGAIFRQILQLTGGQGDNERMARTYASLGEVELELGQVDKAKTRFNKALTFVTNDVRALQGVAGVFMAQGDWSNLLNAYNNIIYHAQEPAQVVQAYLTKGYVLDAKMGLPDKAAQHYEKSLNFDPAQPHTLLRLAELHLRRQGWSEASVFADRGLGLGTAKPATLAGLHLVKVVALRFAGDEAGSLRAFKAAASIDAMLPDQLGAELPQPGRVQALLKERLQAAV